MVERTLDPDVVITSRRQGWVYYRRESTGERWKVSDTCNQCGLCVIGAANADDYDWRKKPGRPGAVRDLRYPTRPDEPVTPGFLEAMIEMATTNPTATVSGCSLRIEGL